MENFDFQAGKIHIRFQKTGPRSITIIEGLDNDLDLKRIAKYMKRSFNCSAAVHIDKNGNEVIQLQGDQTSNVKEWLIVQEILTETDAEMRIVIHGL